MYPTVLFNGQTFTPQALDTMATRFFGVTRALGLAPGDTIACFMKNSPEYVALFVAARRAGLYIVPVNWHFKSAEAGFILEDSGASALFIDAEFIERIAPAVKQSLHVVAIPLVGDAPQAPPAAWPEHRVTHPLVTYTSGTTGRPKGVRRLAFAAEQQAAMQAELAAVSRVFYGVSASSIVLLSAPMYHSGPLALALQACAHGARLLLESSFDAERTLATIQREQVSHVYLVPTMFQRLLRLPAETRHRYSLASVQRVVSTGSPCPPELKRAMIDWWGPVITESYGSSEAGSITLVSSQEWLERPGSVGRPVGAARIAILGDGYEPLPPGAIGRIYARQFSQPDFTYINDDPARRAMEHAGLFTLGDMGYVDDEGYLFICDRQSDMVISGGVNIYPAEIESVLHTLPGVADCAVFGIPDDEFGEALAAAIQPAAGAALNPAGVQAFLKERLATFKVPKVVTFHDSLPREETGKIFKKILRDPYWRHQQRNI